MRGEHQGHDALKGRRAGQGEEVPHDGRVAAARGAVEARQNPDADDEAFRRASDAYAKQVFEAVDPRSEAAIRTESWAAGFAARTAT